METQPIVIAQLTDSHLFSDPQGLHHGHNVLANLKKVLRSINENSEINCVVFTGDLTQDHSEQSYQHFVNAVHECEVTVPMYFVAGNHDDIKLLTKYFSSPPFNTDTTIEFPQWQIQLVASKSETPAGLVSEQSLSSLSQAIDKNKQQLLMMHHHAIDVGYFIDKHGLENKDNFWQVINRFNNIEAIACGHVHGAMTLHSSERSADVGMQNRMVNDVKLYTCPATSIQFDPQFDGVSALDKGPAYRLFYLYPDKKLQTTLVSLALTENPKS